MVSQSPCMWRISFFDRRPGGLHRGVGYCYDNSVIESFWGRMQTELLNRRKWKTRVELANAIFEYLEIFHNRQRRHSSLGMRTPIEYEKLHLDGLTVA
jgi:putative transposase